MSVALVVRVDFAHSVDIDCFLALSAKIFGKIPQKVGIVESLFWHRFPMRMSPARSLLVNVYFQWNS